MTDSPDPKKRSKKKSLPDAAEIKADKPVEIPVDIPDAPGSDPTLSDRGATEEAAARMREMNEGGIDPEAASSAAEEKTGESESVPPPSSGEGGEGYDMPVSGFFDGDRAMNEIDVEMTVNLTSDMLGKLPGRDDLEAPTQAVSGDDLGEAPLERVRFQQAHLRGALEALIFASDTPLKANELAKRASAVLKEVKEQLLSLKSEYQSRGIQLDEVAGGWVFRTSPEFAPFVRELSKEKPVRLTRAQLETLAILAYRQPITRPEIDDIRGVDSGPVLKLLLERDLIRILGKKDEAGRPILYGTAAQFLEFFGLKSLKDLPTLTEFTELNEESRRTVEEELGESLETIQEQLIAESASEAEAHLPGETTETGLVDEHGDETREAPIAEAADTAEVAIVVPKNSRDTITNEGFIEEQTATAEEAARAEQARRDEEEFPDDDDSDFDDDDDDDDDDEDEDEDDEESDEKPDE